MTELALPNKGERRSLIRDLDIEGRPGQVSRRVVLAVLKEIEDLSGSKGVCWPGQATLADAIDYGERTVRRAIDYLSDIGVLEVERAADPSRVSRLHFRINWQAVASMTGRAIKTAAKSVVNAVTGRNQPASSDRPTGQQEQTNRPVASPTLLIDPKRTTTTPETAVVEGVGTSSSNESLTLTSEQLEDDVAVREFFRSNADRLPHTRDAEGLKQVFRLAVHCLEVGRLPGRLFGSLVIRDPQTVDIPKSAREAGDRRLERFARKVDQARRNGGAV